jgi:4-amino-4-deoxy-L-arabinose transferase-like glycosyltransferase
VFARMSSSRNAATKDHDAGRMQMALLALLAIYLVLFFFNSLTRVRAFDPDAMNYVDVARNVTAGRGISQSALGFNQARFPADGNIPPPLTTQAPLYPLAIAAVILIGVDAADAGLLVAGFAYATLLWLAYLLAESLYDRRIAGLSVAILLGNVQLVLVARNAMSETLGISLLLAGLLLLVRGLRRGALGTGAMAAIGLLFGLAFADRYALAPAILVAVGIVATVTYRQSGRWQTVVLRLAVLVSGFALPAVPVLIRNTLLVGTPLGSVPLPVTRDLYSGISAAFHSLAGYYLGSTPHYYVQEAALGGVLLACVISVYLHRSESKIASALFARGRFVLLLWALVYLASLILERLFTFFDLDSRTVLPAQVALDILFAVLIGAALGRRANYLGHIALVLVCVAFLQEVRIATLPPAQTVEQTVAASERLSWIAAETSDRDLIVGVDTEDIAFYLKRSRIVFFARYPYTDYVDYHTLANWVGRHRAEYDRVYFVLPRYSLTASDYGERYGSFVGDLSENRTGPYPEFTLQRRLADADVFEIR